MPVGLKALKFKIVAGFIGALILLAVGGALTYRATVEFAESARWVAHTQEVRASLSQLYADMSDAATSQRNYLITGQRRELDNYAHVAADARQQLEAIHGLVADNPAQLRNAVQLEVLTERVLGTLVHGVRLHQTQGFAAASAFVAEGEGMRGMAAVLALTRRMDVAEADLLVQREAALARGRQHTLSSILATLLLATAIYALLYWGIRREMSARAKAERALIVARELADTANRAKSTFLATMSHEIRTPMNGVLGMLELMSMSKLDAEQRTTLEIVRQSGRSLLRIIDDILDFSKIEAGKLEVRPSVASVGKLVEEVHNIYRGNASSKGLLLMRRVDPGIRPAVSVDPLRLRQILSNFVSNAIKFTSQGSVEIRADLLERGETQDRVRFSVIDTGIGISAASQKRLFEPFNQGEGETTVRFGGTGLGLAICRRLAAMMGGSVELSSTPGEGTTASVTLSLPAADASQLPQGPPSPREGIVRDNAAAPRRAAPSAAQAEREGTLVLLADDHPTNRSLLERQVRLLGYAGETAENGLEALEKWRSGRFSLLITDCNMPEMNGYELTREVRASEAAAGRRRTPIIACTANALSGEAEKCFAAGMDDYLAKPVELSRLCEKLEQWLPLSGGASAPIDRSALAEVSGGDAAVERDLLAGFRHANDADAALLEQAVARSDPAGVKGAAHRIKGSASTIGALALAGVCERIEQAGRDNEWPQIIATMAHFHQECRRLNAHFDLLDIEGRSLT